MQLAIIILVGVLFLGDIINTFDDKSSNVLITGALITLLAWPISIAWAICMMIITAISVIRAHA